MKYDILLFDADNTVLDFDRAEDAALEKAFCECGLHFDENVLNTYRKNNVYQWRLYEKGLTTKEKVLKDRFLDTFRQLGMTAPLHEVSSLYEKYLHQGFYVEPHADEVLQRLQKDCRLYLITNGVLSIQNSRMKGSGLEKYFLRRFVSEEIGFPKPSVKFFEAVFAALPQEDKSRMLVVGDSLTSDVQGGINVGLHTCWYNPKHAEKDADVTPDYEIDDLRKLLNIVYA